MDNILDTKELVNSLLKETDLNKIRKLVEDIHPVDFLEILEDFEDEFYAIIEKLPDDYLVEIINEAEIKDKLEILNKIPE